MTNIQIYVSFVFEFLARVKGWLDARATPGETAWQTYRFLWLVGILFNVVVNPNATFWVAISSVTLSSVLGFCVLSLLYGRLRASKK